MDKILKQLQGKAFNLSPEAYAFLENRRETLLAAPVPKLNIPEFSSDIISKLINLHRHQFTTEEYLQSRIINTASGTIDHIHAEVTAENAVKLGRVKGYSGYPLELIRVAGHFHDIDRSFPKSMIPGEQHARLDPNAYREHKRKHAASSRELTLTLLMKTKETGSVFPDGFIHDLSYLVFRHELGGEKMNGKNIFLPSAIIAELNLNELNDIVTDADSLAYMDANILTNWEESNRDRQSLLNKVHYMYDRMTFEGKSILQNTILKSSEHILGIDVPKEDDLQAIRTILLEVCK